MRVSYLTSIKKKMNKKSNMKLATLIQLLKSKVFDEEPSCIREKYVGYKVMSDYLGV